MIKNAVDKYLNQLENFNGVPRQILEYLTFTYTIHSLLKGQFATPRAVVKIYGFHFLKNIPIKIPHRQRVDEKYFVIHSVIPKHHGNLICSFYT